MHAAHAQSKGLLLSNTCVESSPKYRKKANIVGRYVPGEAVEPQARHGVHTHPALTKTPAFAASFCLHTNYTR